MSCVVLMPLRRHPRRSKQLLGLLNRFPSRSQLRRRRLLLQVSRRDQNPMWDPNRVKYPSPNQSRLAMFPNPIRQRHRGRSTQALQRAAVRDRPRRLGRQHLCPDQRRRYGLPGRRLPLQGRGSGLGDL